jgi:hypothetical protein
LQKRSLAETDPKRFFGKKETDDSLAAQEKRCFIIYEKILTSNREIAL